MRAWIVAVVCALAVGVAHGEQAAPAPSRPRERTRTYRARVVVADLAVLAVGVGGGVIAAHADIPGAEPAALVFLGAGYFAAAPVVHALNDNAPAAWTSLGLRVAPLAISSLLYYGWKLASDCDPVLDHCDVGPLLLASYSTLVTIPTAIIVDWVMLPEKSERASDRPVAVVRVERDASIVGVAGRW